MALSMMQEIAIRDVNGNCRCPCCGKYRRCEDFQDQPGHVTFGGGERMLGHIHMAPLCRFCREPDRED